MVDRATQQQRQGEPLSDCSAAVPAHNALLSRRHLLLAGTGVAAAVVMQYFGGRATASQEAGPTEPTPAEQLSCLSRGPVDIFMR